MDAIVSVFSSVILTVALVGAYTMFALGIVFIYRGSRVLNLAHGAMAMMPAYVAYSLTRGDLHVAIKLIFSVGIAVSAAGAMRSRINERANPIVRWMLSSAGGLLAAGLAYLVLGLRLPVYLALVVAIGIGGIIGVAVERSVVRRLRAASPTAQTVGTVAVLGLLIALAARVWGTTPVRGPAIFPEKSFRVGNSVVELGDIGLFVSALVVAGLFMALFRYTHLGLAMRASADNRRAAALMGIDPDKTTTIAWLFAGMLAALGGVLLGASTNLHPYTLSLQVLPAFVAALIGGLESIRGALYGSLIVGLTVGIVPTMGGFGRQVGASQLGLAVLAFIVMSLRGQRFSATDVRSGL